MSEPLELNGLDGANPLGFLAALGTLALCDRLDLNPRMSWRPFANSYRPLLRVDDPAKLSERLSTCLSDDLQGDPPDWCSGTVIKRPKEAYRSFAEGAARRASHRDRHAADFAAAYASDAATEEKSQDVIPSRLSFCNGQSNKVLLRDYRDLVHQLTPADIESALFHTWHATDACKTFRWEPRDLRFYALRAQDPGAATVYSSRGGNILAFWALTLLPSFPSGNGELVTAAFARLDDGGRSADFFSWPIWDPPLSADPVVSLMLDPAFHRQVTDAANQQNRGIHAVYRCKRTSYQKGLYFSPSFAV